MLWYSISTSDCRVCESCRTGTSRTSYRNKTPDSVEAKIVATVESARGVHLNVIPPKDSRQPQHQCGGVDGAALLGLQPVTAVSSGSACSSATTAPSHVLTALGHSEQLAYASVRFGIGRFKQLRLTRWLSMRSLPSTACASSLHLYSFL